MASLIRRFATSQNSTGKEGTAVGNLCPACASLNLSPAKFTARETTTALSATVGSEFDPTGFDPTVLGFLDEIYSKRVACTFCCLVYNATHSDTGSGIGHDGLDAGGQRVRTKVEWHLDFRSADSKPTTRRLRIFSDDDKFPDFYVVPILPDLKEQPLGRVKDKHIADPLLLFEWATTCRNNHPNCREHQTAGLAPFTAGIRLIDVSRLCLQDISVEQLSTSSIEYATLSYVWGPLRQPCTLIMSNYEALHVNGSLGPASNRKLPRTVLDSFSVAQKLGIAYIWVDALCIIQDSFKDWEIQSRMMDKIYQRAVLTICGAVGMDSNAGMPGIGETPRYLKQNLGLYRNLQLTTVKPVADIIRASAWDSRAWTFQERLLSARCAIFTIDGMVWQCRTATWREDIKSPLENTLWNLDSVGSPLGALVGNPVRSYSSCVKIYSGRKLTLASDKLHAFNGLGEVLVRNLRSKLVFGLPSRYWDWALLWEPESAGGILDGGYRETLPSWSWSGWDQQVSWRLSTVAGPLSDLHGWLVHRTWIVWYIGTAEEWKLVWNSKDFTPSHTSGNRWDGYLPGQHDPYGRSEDAAGCRHRKKVRKDLTTTNDDPLSMHPPTPRNGCLLFQTFTASFALSRKSMSDSVFKSSLNPGLQRFGIVDNCGDWCGTILLDSSWLNNVGGVFEFAAISEAKEFALEELNTWTYYIPEERQQAEWYCFYALMLKWVDDELLGQGAVAERIGLAKIFQSSFFSGSFSECSWRTITLQ